MPLMFRLILLLTSSQPIQEATSDIFVHKIGTKTLSGILQGPLRVMLCLQRQAPVALIASPGLENLKVQAMLCLTAFLPLAHAVAGKTYMKNMKL